MTTTTKPTRKRRKPAPVTGALKMILAAGALITTMIGADLLATQDQTPVIVQTQSQPSNTMVVVIPEMRNQPVSRVSNAPVPQVQIPAPVVSSKSSA